MITTKQATSFINAINRHLEAVKDSPPQVGSLEERAKKVSDYVSKDSARAGQLRKLPECALANFLICYKATNTGSELELLSNGINTFLETKPDITDIKNISISELKKYLLEEATHNRLGNISAARLNEIGDEVIINLVLFARSFQEEAVKCDQEGNVTIYRSVELSTDEDKMETFILKNASQDRLIVSDEEIERLNKVWKEKGIMFGLFGLQDDKMIVASMFPTNDPFNIDINATNDETKQPAVFRIMVSKITGAPSQASTLPKNQTIPFEGDKWYKDIPLLSFIGTLAFTGLTAFWAFKSDSKGFPAGLSILGALGTAGSAIIKWFPEIPISMSMGSLMRKSLKGLFR